MANDALTGEALLPANVLKVQLTTASTTTDTALSEHSLPEDELLEASLAETAEDNAQPALLRLPAELRNRIYEEALVFHNEIIVYSGGSSTKSPALLQVCQQIRNEALKLYYSRNIFLFATSSKRLLVHRIKALLSWLQGIGSTARKELREVRLPKYLVKKSAAMALEQYQNELRRYGCELQRGVLHAKTTNDKGEVSWWSNPDGLEL